MAMPPPALDCAHTIRVEARGNPQDVPIAVTVKHHQFRLVQITANSKLGHFAEPFSTYVQRAPLLECDRTVDDCVLN